MSRLVWLVDPEPFHDDGEKLLGQLAAQNIEVCKITYSDVLLGKVPVFTEDDCVVCYGSIGIIRKLSTTNLSPGPWCNLKNFEFLTYVTYLGDFLLNRRYFVLPAIEFFKRAKEIGNYFYTDSLFVRPNSGVKTFTGHVVKISECRSIEQFTQPHTLVVIAAPVKKIEAEWRYVIGRHKVISHHLYILNDEIDLDFAALPADTVSDPKANALVEQVLTHLKELDWEPDPVWVLDVGKIGDNYSVIEINSFSCSGLYKCDYSNVVREVSKIALEEFEYQKNLR